VVTETASRVPELRCCGGNPLFRIPKLGPASVGPFLPERLTAAAPSPALKGGRGFGEGAQHRANLHMPLPPASLPDGFGSRS
jgi:hypothetical protein